MPGSTISLCSEPDEFTDALQQRCHVELFVTQRGQFRARLTRIALPRLRLVAAEEWLPRIAFVSAGERSAILILPLDPGPSQAWAGIPLRTGEVITINAGQGVHARTAGRCRWGVICLAARDLARYGRTLLGPEFAVLSGVRRWRPAAASLRSLMRLFNAAIQVTNAWPDAPSRADAAHGLEQQLVAALVECLSAGPNATARQRYVDIMDRLESFLRDRPNRFPSEVELCVALGVSARTLRRWCKAHLGMTPNRYLHLRQMQRIRHALHNADHFGATVSELARRHGVKELGRFAGAYRDLFGELPSATRRRAMTPERGISLPRTKHLIHH